jgi:transloator
MNDLKIPKGPTVPTLDTSVTQSTSLSKEIDSLLSGLGVNGVKGMTPDVMNTVSTAMKLGFASIFASSGFAPKRSGDVELVLAEVSAKLSETREDTSLESVKSNQEKIRTSQQEQQSKLEERKEKIEEAVANDRKSGIGAIFAKIFQAIALLFTYIAAGVMMATGVGVGVAALLIAGAIAMTIQFADSIAKDASGGLGIAGLVAKSLGKSEEEIAKADEVFGKVMTGLTIALSVATIAVTLGPALLSAVAKGIAKIASSALTTAINTGNQTASNVGNTLAHVAINLGSKASSMSSVVQGTAQVSTSTINTMKTISTVGTAVSQVGGGTTGIVTATIVADSQKAQAEAKRLEAEGQEMDAVQKTLESLIDQALEMLMNANQISNQILDSAIQGLNDRTDTLMRTRFSG